MCVCNTELGTSCDTTVATIWHWVKVAASRDFSAFFFYMNPTHLVKKFGYLCENKSFRKTMLACLSVAQAGWIHGEKKANKSRDTVTLSPALLLQHACHCSFFCLSVHLQPDGLRQGERQPAHWGFHNSGRAAWRESWREWRESWHEWRENIVISLHYGQMIFTDLHSTETKTVKLS